MNTIINMDYSQSGAEQGQYGEGSIPCVPKWKRVLDVACILMATPLLLPLGVLIGLVIKIVSPGPALFKQERVGYRGRTFTCFKFRTMKINSDPGLHQAHLKRLMNSDQPMIKLDAGRDPRLIPFGKLLRSLGLDELPQLLNVLRGEMSLVGPRPCLAYECKEYKARHCRRLEALPGLTGYWQVNGKNRTTFEEMINLDIYYVDHQSVLLDLSIMFRTVPAILAQAWDLRRRKQAAAGLGVPAAGMGRLRDRVL
jgi:lipopolysaccharide/colanic/teichoic acid biosynthesis glycosyltransferase